jgi:hypothetical protein
MQVDIKVIAHTMPCALRITVSAVKVLPIQQRAAEVHRVLSPYRFSTVGTAHIFLLYLFHRLPR